MREAMTREAEEVARTTGLKKEMRAEYVRRYVEQSPSAAALWAASQESTRKPRRALEPAGSDVKGMRPAAVDGPFETAQRPRA